MTGQNRKRTAPFLLAAFSVLACAVYWIGLDGPFLFDDAPNFAGIKSWLAGQMPLQKVLFGNDSWVLHRTLAMASFALNAHMFGYDPYGFKLVNLVVHLACGTVAFLFLSKLLTRDPVLARRAQLVAVLIAGAWLLHPLNVSTVLYAVQRMTQIAALCCLLGLWLYVSTRIRQERGEARFGWPVLFVLIPLLTLLGIQGKQSAAVLPALCLVVELAYFRMPRAWPRPLQAFYGLFLLLPALLAVFAFIAKPDLLFKGYGEYPFTPMQRLMSEARVLCDYLRMLLAPHSPSMGVYTDDYAVSTSLMSPPTTLLAIAFLLAATIAAWRARKAWPCIFAGWSLFLVAHAVEGTILPIELYYEHRNYLPAFGAFLACAGLVAATGRWMGGRGIRGGRIGIVAMVALVAMLALQTHGRARIWSDPVLLSDSALRSHPNSSRAIVNYIGMTATYGNYQHAREVADRSIATTTNPETRAHVLLFRIWLDCHFKQQASYADLKAAVASLPPYMNLTTIQMLRFARTPFENGPCEGMSLEQMADAHATIVDNATSQSDDAWPKYYIRLKSARLYAQADRWDLALEQARKTQRPSTPVPGMSFLVMALISNGLMDEARMVHQQAIARAEPDSRDDAAAIEQMAQMLAAAERSGGRFKPKVRAK